MPTPHHSAGSLWHLSWPVWRSVAIRTWQEASDDNIGLAAAGVAFYGFIALVPMLSATVLTYGIFAEPGTVVRHMQALTSVMPADVATFAESRPPLIALTIVFNALTMSWSSVLFG